jgi:hypothetical protein
VRRLLMTAGVVSAALAVLASGTTAFAAAKSPFEPGLYVGRTSQGEPVKVRLTVGGAACEGKTCIFPPSDEAEINVTETCSGEGSTNEYLDLSDTVVPKSGLVHVSTQGFSKLVATIKVGHHGTLTGKVRATSKLEDGEKCDSGPVTIAAKIGGSTR